MVVVASATEVAVVRTHRSQLRKNTLSNTQQAVVVAALATEAAVGVAVVASETVVVVEVRCLLQLA